MHYREFLNDLLNKTSEIALKNFGKVSSIAKEGDSNQVLTETDLAISKYLVERIKKEFPEHNIIDEETGVINNRSQYTWILDPIDGTSNFAIGLPTYGIMIGLLQNGTPIAGGIALPSIGEIYIAAKKEGTFCNGKKIQLASKQNLASSLIAYGIDGHQENPDFTEKECQDLAKIILHIRNLRTSNSCYDVAMVVKGKYGAWINRSQKIWDNVAEHIVAEESGATVTDFNGNPLKYSNAVNRIKEDFTICLAPPQIHSELMKIILS